VQPPGLSAPPGFTSMPNMGSSVQNTSASNPPQPPNYLFLNQIPSHPLFDPSAPEFQIPYLLPMGFQPQQILGQPPFGSPEPGFQPYQIANLLPIGSPAPGFQIPQPPLGSPKPEIQPHQIPYLVPIGNHNIPPPPPFVSLAPGFQQQGDQFLPPPTPMFAPQQQFSKTKLMTASDIRFIASSI